MVLPKLSLKNHWWNFCKYVDTLTTILGKTIIDGAILKMVVPKIVVVMHVKIKIGDQMKHSSSHALEKLELMCLNP